ncbi:hypothetical protein HN51_036472 [Arachis hypogaea]
MERDSKVDKSGTGLERDVKYKQNGWWLLAATIPRTPTTTFMAPETPATNEKLEAKAKQNNPFSGDLLHLQRRQPQSQWKNKRLDLSRGGGRQQPLGDDF